MYAGLHEWNADRLSALLPQGVAISLPPSALNTRDHGRTRGLSAGVDNLFIVAANAAPTTSKKTAAPAKQGAAQIQPLRIHCPRIRGRTANFTLPLEILLDKNAVGPVSIPASPHATTRSLLSTPRRELRARRRGKLYIVE